MLIKNIKYFNLQIESNNLFTFYCKTKSLVISIIINLPKTLRLYSNSLIS